MKNWIVVLMVVVCLLPAGISYAQPAEKAGSVSMPLSKEEADQLRASVQGLREVFGVEDQNTKTAGNQHQQKKSMADVADEALDMTNKMVSQAAESIQKVAPDVWRIMVKQQYAQAFANIVLPCMLLVVLFVYYKTLRKWCPDYETISDSENRGVFWFFQYPFSAACGVVCGVWISCAVFYSIKYLINPEFYAIRDLLMILLGKGANVG